MARVGVLGAGSWGTAFAQVLADAGSEVVLWGRDEAVISEINGSHSNSKFHPGVTLPKNLKGSINSQDVLACEVVVLAIPAQTLRANLQLWKSFVSPSAVVVSLLKGLEVSSASRVSEIVEQEWGTVGRNFAMITGPNLAGEIILRQPAAAVVASTDESTSLSLQSLCGTAYFRPYTTSDVVGCEIAGVGKNVIALSVGMAVGLGMGDNTKASVITRGLAEIARLGEAMGGDEATFAGLAGLGDLVATCSSPLSRNRTFGERLGRGLSVAESIAATSTTAEAVKSAKPLLALAALYGVEMPITQAVVGVIDGQIIPQDAVRMLMSREKRSE